ncbi:MAG: hypothetical protein ABIY55_35345, partial [Kofleriaceae bacterium]
MRWLLEVIGAVIMLVATTRPGVGATRRGAILTLVVNGVAAGDQIVYLEPGGPILPVAALHAAGLDVRGPVQQIDGVAYVAVGALNVTFVVDEDAMTIRLTARAEDLPDTRIDLAGVRRPVGMIVADGASLYANYGVHTLDARVDGFAETGLRTGAMLAYSSVSMRAGQHFARGLSNVTIDDHHDLRRVVAGDQAATAG